MAGIIYRPTWSLSNLEHHRVSLYLMTEASIILLLCIPAGRARASVTGHFSLGSLWNLLAVSICLRMMLNLLRNKVYTKKQWLQGQCNLLSSIVHLLILSRLQFTVNKKSCIPEEKKPKHVVSSIAHWCRKSCRTAAALNAAL